MRNVKEVQGRLVKMINSVGDISGRDCAVDVRIVVCAVDVHRIVFIQLFAPAFVGAIGCSDSDGDFCREVRIQGCEVIPLIGPAIGLASVERFDILGVVRTTQISHLLIGRGFATCRNINRHCAPRVVARVIMPTRFLDVGIAFHDNLKFVRIFFFGC